MWSCLQGSETADSMDLEFRWMRITGCECFRNRTWVSCMLVTAKASLQPQTSDLYLKHFLSYISTVSYHSALLQTTSKLQYTTRMSYFKINNTPQKYPCSYSVNMHFLLKNMLKKICWKSPDIHTHFWGGGELYSNMTFKMLQVVQLFLQKVKLEIIHL